MDEVREHGLPSAPGTPEQERLDAAVSMIGSLDAEEKAFNEQLRERKLAAKAELIEAEKAVETIETQAKIDANGGEVPPTLTLEVPQ